MTLTRTALPLIGVMSVVAITLGQAARAADSRAASADGSSGASTQIEEVVVTAERRVEPLKDVPISVQAESGEQLNTQAVSDTSLLASISPTLNFQNAFGASASSFSLRGVTSVADQGAIQPSTAMVVDGVALYRQGEFVMNLEDIDRIEVLDGPQGTLFGKNSTAGVINIVTNQPANDIEIKATGLATSDGEFAVHGLVNIPVSDDIRLRVSGFMDDQNPLIKNFGPAPNVAGMHSYGFDGKVAVDINDDVSFVLQGTFAHTNSSWGQNLPINPSVFGALQQAIVAPSQIKFGSTSIKMDEPAIDLYETHRVSGTLNWRLSDALSLISITSYNSFEEHQDVDGDATPAGIIVGKGQSLPGTSYPFYFVDYGLKQRFPDAYAYVSEEARLNYVDGPINALGGIYYQDFHDRSQTLLPLILDSSLLGGPPGTPFFSLQFPHSHVGDRTESVFGDVTYALWDQVKFFGGLRYTHENVSVDYHREDFFMPAALFDPLTGAINSAPTNTVNTTTAHSVYNLSGRAGVQYQPTQNLNVYFSYARGYQAPAVDTSQNLAAGRDPIIKPELADSIEVGSKLRLFDNTLAVNVALFDEQIYGIQLGILQPGLTLTPVLINAGTLRTRGVEADGEWAATDHLTFRSGVAYDDATYGRFFFVCNPTQLANGTCTNQPIAGFQNIFGQQAIQSPRFKVTVNADYADAVPTWDWTYRFHVDWTWSSSIIYGLGGDPLTREPGHGMLDLSFALNSLDNHWSAQFFAKNLTNEFYYSNLINFATIAQPLGNVSRDFQRYGGLKISYSY